MRMKRAAIIGLSVALTIVPTFAFAAGSKDYTSSSTSSTTTQNNNLGTGSAGTSEPTKGTAVHVEASGTIITTTGSTNDKSGTVISLVVDTKTTEGKAVVSNEEGGVEIGTLDVHFADGIAETAGLPMDVVAKIDKLNQGKPVSEVLGSMISTDLSRYEKVGNTRAVIVYDSVTELTKTATELILHVDVEMGTEMAAVYYDNNTGRWVYVPVTVDPANNIVKLMVPGSCTLQLLKRV